MSLTREQRAALDALPAKRRAFVLAYVGEAKGVAVEAARIAGYAYPDPEGARLLGDARVALVVDLLRAPREERAIATMEQLRELWTGWALEGAMETRLGNGEPVVVPLEAKDRIKAGELLAKSLGGFVERKELSGPGGGPIAGTVNVTIAPDVARELARDKPAKEGGEG